MVENNWKCLHCSPPPLRELIEARSSMGTVEKRIVVRREDLYDTQWRHITHWRNALSAEGSGGG